MVQVREEASPGVAVGMLILGVAEVAVGVMARVEGKVKGEAVDIK